MLIIKYYNWGYILFLFCFLFLFLNVIQAKTKKHNITFILHKNFDFNVLF